MTEKDPFQDFNSKPKMPERTVIVPAPGGKRRGAESTSNFRIPILDSGGSSQTLESSTENPLIRCGEELFALARTLRIMPDHKNIQELRNKVLNMVKSFEGEAMGCGAGQEPTQLASYSMCCLLDEMVLHTPWGNQSNWRGESLLSTLYSDAHGGEKFFQILERVSKEPAQNIDLLEFIFICLSLGFEGKYAVMDRGMEQLERVSQNLYQAIRSQRGEAGRALSINWQGVRDRSPAISRFIPLWVVPIATCGVAVLIYFLFNYSINQASNEVYVELNNIGKEANQLNHLSAPVNDSSNSQEILPAKSGSSFAESLILNLREETMRGLVSINEIGYSTNIVIHNTGMFNAGSARVNESYFPLLSKIGVILKNIPGPIYVIGHTDNVPIRSLKHPSNWHLSSARANTVSKLLSFSIKEPGKIKSEGRADTEPLTNNDSPENRQKNRRVEIRIPRS
jgi:type VI secretion system protein ImpK